MYIAEGIEPPVEIQKLLCIRDAKGDILIKKYKIKITIYFFFLLQQSAPGWSKKWRVLHFLHPYYVCQKSVIKQSLDKKHYREIKWKDKMQ